MSAEQGAHSYAMSLAVADVHDARTAHRSYRAAMPVERARETVGALASPV